MPESSKLQISDLETIEPVVEQEITIEEAKKLSVGVQTRAIKSIRSLRIPKSYDALRLKIWLRSKLSKICKHPHFFGC